MKTQTWMATILLVLVTGMVISIPVTSAQEPIQLLTNGDFENAAESWLAVNAHLNRVNGRTGTAVSWEAHGLAGIYQQVPITPGTTVRLAAWTKGNGSSDLWLRQRVGIDPHGGVDPQHATVSWSLPGQFTSEWGQLVVEAEAKGDYITVFLTGNPDKAASTILFDDATLYAVAYPIPAPPPLPAPTVDPLVIGLVDGIGVAPGTQGYRATLPQTSEDNNIRLLGAILLLFVCVTSISVRMAIKRGMIVFNLHL